MTPCNDYIAETEGSRVTDLVSTFQAILPYCTLCQARRQNRWTTTVRASPLDPLPCPTPLCWAPAAADKKKSERNRSERPETLKSRSANRRHPIGNIDCEICADEIIRSRQPAPNVRSMRLSRRLYHSGGPHPEALLASGCCGEMAAERLGTASAQPPFQS